MSATRCLPVLVIVAAMGFSSYADVVVPPSDLGPGDQYRLIFVTTDKIVPGSSEISTYNTFVTTNAQGNATLWALTQDWTAVGSTYNPLVHARDNTSTDPSAALQYPIYNVRDERIADSYADLWGGSLHTAVVYDRDGNTPDELIVYTGTLSNGTTDLTSALDRTSVRAGLRNRSDSWWVYGPAYGEPLSAQRMYAISGVVPEPTTLSLLVLGSVLLFRRRRAG